jgi:hypothetical protein
MTAIPLLSGIAGTETGEFVRSYPLNFEPIIISSGISEGQLKLIPGAVSLGVGPGSDRGGINWGGSLYRVLGTKLCLIGSDNSVTVLGDVRPGSRCAFDYSFDRLAIWSGGNLFYYSIALGLVQVVNANLGTAIDGMWIDGYFMSTDGTYVVVTELSDPLTVKPLKYGSAEEDPDPVTGLIKYREEAYVFGRNTTQVFSNVGGNGFPFQDNKGAGFPFGSVGPMAKALLGDGFAFVGSGRNQGLNVYFFSLGGLPKPIGCRELCDALDALDDPSVVEVESRSDRNERRLLVHLPTETWTFLLNASALAQQPIWYRMRTGLGQYRCRNAVDAYGLTIVGDTQSGSFGYLTQQDDQHFGSDPGGQFDVGMIYGGGTGAIIHSIELMGLPGRGRAGSVFLSMTRDGETFGAERAVAFTPAERSKRIAWRPHCRVGNYIGLRFRFSGGSLPGIAACEVKAAALTS